MENSKKLSDYLDRTGTKRSDFARRVGVHPAAITRYCQGASRPETVETAIAIERATGGAVKASAWANPANAKPDLDTAFRIEQDTNGLIKAASWISK